MARIFSLRFEFQKAPHTALVAMLGGESNHVSFSVRLDDELKHIIPTGVIRLQTTDDGTVVKEPQYIIRNELTHLVKQAIEEYLDSKLEV